MLTRILLIFTGFANFLLGLFVLLYNPRERINQIYFSLALGLTFWAAGPIGILIGGNLDLFSRLSFFGASILVSAILLFSISIGQVEEKLFQIKFIIPTLLGITFAILSITTNLIIAGATFTQKIIQISYGPLYQLFLLYAVICVLGSVYLLFRKFRKSTGLTREQLKYTFLGFALFVIPAIITNGVLPGVFGISRFNQLGPAFSVFLLLAIGYAILEYRLMEIKVVLRQGTLFTLLFATIIFLFVLATSFLANILPGFYAILIPAALITFGFIPFKNLLEKWIDKFFFRSHYDYRAAVQDLSHTLSNIAELDELLEEFLKKTTSYLKVSKGQIVLLLEKDHFISRLNIGIPTSEQNLVIPANNVLARHMERHPEEILDKDYLAYILPKEEHRKSEMLALKTELDTLGYALAVPITVKRVVIGIMFLGEKLSKDIFSLQDVQLLDVIGREVGPVIESARLYEQTQQLNRDLIVSNEAKSHFISIVSHQFRTPLSAIRMNAELCKDNLKNKFWGPEEEEESLETMHERALFLVDILDNIFDAMAIDARRISVQRKPSVLWELFENARMELSKEIKEKQVNFILTKSPSLIRESSVDVPKIAKIAKVLLTNAVLYNKTGGTVEVKIEHRNIGGKQFVQCSVEDTGIGIPPSELKKIFDKFYRSPNAIKEVPNGTGLGLFIAKNFIELHGGEMWVTSELDRGSTFYFTLPEVRTS